MVKATKQQPKPTFYEIVVQGSPKMTRGFLAGLVIGAGHASTVIFHHDARIYEESAWEKLTELIRPQLRDIHLVADAATRRLLVKQSQRIEQEIGLSVVASRYIRSAKLPFCFKAYARRYGVEIMAKLHSLPAGLRLVDFETDEKINPSAVGIEAYTPVHDYEIEGQGNVVGRVDLVVQARQELDSHPLIEPGIIKLNLGK